MTPSAREQVRVTFLPRNRSVFVLPGTTVPEAAARAGLTIDTPCGGAGTCGKCRVRFVSDAPAATHADRDRLSADKIADGWRLACRTALTAEATIEIPAESLLVGKHRIVAQAAGGHMHIQPAVRKQFVHLDPPAREDDAPDLLRLERAVGAVHTDLDTLRILSRRLRQNAFAGTAVLAGDRLLDLQPGDTSAHCYGVAVDVGTTTLAASLLDLATGTELAVDSAMNPQVRHGDDVLSRIRLCRETPDQCGTLQRAVQDEITALVERLCEQAGIRPADVYEVTLAGNTTMEHLVCGIDVGPLGEAPFTPAHARGLDLPAREIGLAIHPAGRAYVFPIIAGFVGGDTVACLLATRSLEADGPTLLVDIGTNGEIVLCNGRECWAASTAAGPAFEGARIRCGMRAADGAIEKVVLGGDVRTSVIGGGRAIGLCGSALIDAAAEMLRHGLLGQTGRLLPADECPPDVPDALRRRLGETDGEPHFVLADDDEAAGDPVVLTQRDLRELQLATGAIRAGVAILLRQAGIAPGDLSRVLLAGGFGSFIRRSNAQRLGLLPMEIHHERIHYVGNASLEGARLALMSTDARARAEQLARTARHVNLACDPHFQDEYADAMIFPE